MLDTIIDNAIATERTKAESDRVNDTIMLLELEIERAKEPDCKLDNEYVKYLEFKVECLERRISAFGSKVNAEPKEKADCRVVCSLTKTEKALFESKLKDGETFQKILRKLIINYIIEE